MNEVNEWEEGVIEKADEQVIYVRKSNRNKKSKVEIEEIRILPKSQLTKDLMQGDLGNVSTHINARFSRKGREG